MWEPEPGWHPLPGGTGASTVGVWRAALGDQPVVIKRLARPAPTTRAELRDPGHSAYWRREADVLAHRDRCRHAGRCGRCRRPSRRTTRGSRSPASGSRTPPLSGLFVAMALGRFAGADLPRPRFLARTSCATGWPASSGGGGWPTLARTTVADVADHLW